MHRNGDIVTLNVSKSEGAGEGSLEVSAGVTGMVVSAPPAGGIATYVVDFGPEGQWNCTDEELEGLQSRRDTEPVDDNVRENDDSLEMVIEEIVGISPENGDLLRREAVEEVVPLGTAIPDQSLTFEHGPEEGKKLSFEEDMARMIAQLEKEKCC